MLCRVRRRAARLQLEGDPRSSRGPLERPGRRDLAKELPDELVAVLSGLVEFAWVRDDDSYTALIGRADHYGEPSLAPSLDGGRDELASEKGERLEIDTNSESANSIAKELSCR